MGGDRIDQDEQEDLKRLRKLALKRAMEALEAGVPRASMLAVIVKLLDNTGNLEPAEPPRPPLPPLPFPADERPQQATSTPPQSTRAALAADKAVPDVATEGDPPRLEAQYRRPLGDTYDL